MPFHSSSLFLPWPLNLTIFTSSPHNSSSTGTLSFSFPLTVSPSSLLLLLFYRDMAKAAEAQPAMLTATFSTGAGSQPSQPLHTPAVSPAVAKKRLRDEPLSILADDIASLFHRQILDLHRLLSHHRLRLVAAAEDAVRKRLKAKEDEMERVRRINRALEDQLRTLAVENRGWRELAEANEAAASFLRSNLEQVVAAQVRMEEKQSRGSAGDDAESCCCGEIGDGEAAAAAVEAPKRVCRRCWEREAAVLLLPCRHLCLCADCGPAASSCPVCECSKGGSVNINLL
ncbi:hypothetical protein AXF42_Ash002336 [Apostasia shenzhenica]|uniref:RING-type domain-containing protein n=1 Tax=Apostasia shenzhenica TaxID=1088818 RepID=A0A2I0AN90_9ASPA|nr:hypothetical protein AXF42_Ash002336 [Apostasia shenzhenica]